MQAIQILFKDCKLNVKFLWKNGIFNKFRDVADNMDLIVILTEFEEYYNMKFQKPPVLTKKLAEPK